MTIYTSLKSMNGRVEEIQRAALENWRLRLPGCEIVTFEGTPPLFGEIARKVTKSAAKVVMYANADILFSPEIARVVQWGEEQTEDFLVIGRRTDELPGGQRELHRPSGMDYFIFRAGMFEDLPETRVGRAYYDSALLAYCQRRGILVVDASEVLTVVHQWHDYGHVDGGRNEVFEGEEAQANRQNNGLRDFGPHLADVGRKLGWQESEEGRERRLVVRRKRVPWLRRLGRWSWWQRMTRGGIGIWGIHEYVGRNGCRYFTRSVVALWSKNSNVQMRFRQVVEAPKGIWTGFDFPCMVKGWRERAKARARGEMVEWTVFLWDPPALSYRDWFPPLKWAIDWVWRWFGRRCDRLVLNIHPGLLGEMGFGQEELEGWKASGKLELRMQDAFEEVGESGQWSVVSGQWAVGSGQEEYDFGVLSNWSKAKGGELMAQAMARMPGKKCLWIGDCGKVENRSDLVSTFRFMGRLPQEQAMAELRKCRVLVAPYLGVPSLRWNFVLKLFEYMQLGRPIVASDNPGNVEVARRYPGRVVLFKSGEVEDLVAKLTSGQWGEF